MKYPSYQRESYASNWNFYEDLPTWGKFIMSTLILAPLAQGLYELIRSWFSK